VVAETVVQQRRQREATIRRQTRMEHRKAIEEHRSEIATAETPAPPAAPAPAEVPVDLPEEGSSPPHLRI
jgi:hypothetical protein